jgi:hypothetical protein
MMNLPKKHLQSPRGQILILFLLLLVLATAIVLSVASRTVTDIKVTSTSDESNRAYFAAEAGVEEALKKAETTTGPVTLKLDFNDISTEATTELSDVGVGARDTYVYPLPVERDDVAQINMLRSYPNLDTGWCPTGTFPQADCKLTVSWGTDPTGVNLGNQAIEVSVIYNYPVLNSGPVFGISKWGFDPIVGSSIPHKNNFCGMASGVQNIPVAQRKKKDPISGIERTVFYEATFNIRTGDVGGGPGVCPVNKHGPGIDAKHPVFLRIRPLYNTIPIPIVVEASPPTPDIPNQGDKIVSVGKTDSGVTRKIEVVTTYPAMPAIFDYVLFNGGKPLVKPPP